MMENKFPTITDDDLPTLVEQGTITILQFLSDACASCRQLTRVLLSLQPELPANVRIMSVSAPDSPRLTSHFDVNAVPTLLIIKDGQAIKRSIGVDRRQVLKQRIIDVVNAGSR